MINNNSSGYAQREDIKGILSIYEINTRVWLKELSLKYQKEIRLDNIAKEEITNFKKLGFDALWLMGVWRSSKRDRVVMGAFPISYKKAIKEKKNA